jgi:hypothetical protein
MSRPKANETLTLVIDGRVFAPDEAALRLSKLVHGAVKAAAHDHPDMNLSPNNILSITKRVVSQLMGNSYGLEIFVALARGEVKAGSTVTVLPSGPLEEPGGRDTEVDDGSV